MHLDPSNLQRRAPLLFVMFTPEQLAEAVAKAYTETMREQGREPLEPIVTVSMGGQECKIAPPKAPVGTLPIEAVRDDETRATV